MIRVGIECEQLEGHRFGVGHTLAQLLETAAKTPGIESKYRFVLYFKKELPKDEFLAHPVFEKKILTGGLIPASFNIFYHIVIPIAYWRDRLDCFFFPSYMLPAFFIGKATVLLTNDVYWEAHHGGLPFRYRLAYRLFCRWAALRAKKIVTISDFSKKELRKFYKIHDTKVTANPWGLNGAFKILPRDEKYAKRIGEIKKEFGIKKDFFLSLGQAFPRRHIKESAEAFARIAGQYPDVQYLVACADKYNPPVLAKLIKNANQTIGREAIIYTTYLKHDKVIYLMNETLALAYVSDKEALGLPPLEALACGRPAIIKDNEISRELFGDEGYFVADADNPENIAGQMERILRDKKEVEEIIKKQSPRLKRYNWPTHINRLLNIIDEMVEK